MRRPAPTLLIVLILCASACSSAPAKDVPPIADEIDTVIPVEKPASPDEADEFEEPEEEAEPAEPQASFDCASATLVSAVPMKGSKPASVTIDGATYAIDWRGDLNADGAEDILVKHSCDSGVCDYLGYVLCEGGYAQVLTLDAASKVVVTPLDTGWATLDVDEVDEDETTTTRKMSWGGSGYGDE